VVLEDLGSCSRPDALPQIRVLAEPVEDFGECFWIPRRREEAGTAFLEDRGELSNLHLVAAALGFPLLKKSSVEFVYHYYRQAEAAPFLRDVSFKRDPLGEHPSIGHEWDLILGIEEWGPIELEFIAALFQAGKAFEPDDGRLSVLGIARLRLNF
jgi:hypothetical protein